MNDQIKVHDMLCPDPAHPYPWQCFYCELIIKTRKDERLRAQSMIDRVNPYGDQIRKV